jgi:hypothetical protein
VPQCPVSLDVLTQAPSQSVRLSLHMPVQYPSSHTWSASHAVLHVPQCAGSVSRWVHAPEQRDSPSSQPAEHSPLSHVFGAVHGELQAPQCSMLVSVSTHSSPHSVLPGGHEQTEDEHAQPSAQTSPQVPQFFGSVSRLVHAPSQSVPSLHPCFSSSPPQLARPSQAESATSAVQ